MNKTFKILLTLFICLSLNACKYNKEKQEVSPMIMVDGDIYLKTDEKGTPPSCGTGLYKITSSVDSDETPSKEGQSNFGIGEDESYLYQRYDDNTINVYMDGEWFMFRKENNDYGVSDLPLGIKVSVVSLKDNILTLKVDNQSGYEMVFNKHGQLQRLDNNQWLDISMVDGALIEDTVYTLKDLENVQIEYDLNNLYGDLESGTYRLLWEDTEVTFNIE